jgi:hypothetical protein
MAKNPPAIIPSALYPFVDKLKEMVEAQDDWIVQQQLIELLTVVHCLNKSKSFDTARYIADSMHKHIRQIITQHEQGI